MSSSVLTKWTGPLIFAIALLLRVAGLGWGLPDATKAFSLHPDEPVILGVSQQINIAQGKVDPGFYNYGTLYLTALNIASKVIDGYHPLAQTATESDARNQVRLYHLAGRWISVFSGAALAWVLFAIGARISGTVAGVAAGLAIAFSPVLTVHSRFQTVDMLATLFVALALLYAVRILYAADVKDATRCALLSAMFAGLSAGTKYSGILAVLAPLTALAITKPKSWARTSILACVTCLAAFGLGTPGIVLNTTKFWEDFRYEMLHTSTGHGLVFQDTPSGFAMHFSHLVWGVGAVITLLGIAGLVTATIRREKWLWVIAPFALITFILIGRAEVKFIRYVFPLIPVIALGFGYLAGMPNTGTTTHWTRLRIVFAIFGLGGLGGGGLSSALVLSQAMMQPDSRDAAAQYLRENAPGKLIGIVADPWFYTATVNPFTMAPRAIGSARQWNLIRSTTATTDPQLVQHMSSDPSTRRNWDLGLLNEDSPDYVVYSSFEVNDIERILKSNPSADPDAEWNRAKTFVALLKERYDLDHVIAPESAAAIEIEGFRSDPLLRVHDVMYIRPAIWIWKRKTQS